MATAIEEIEVVLDVVDEFTETFTDFLVKLGEVETIAESVDDLTIDVDVRDRELDALLGKLAAANMGAVGTSASTSGIDVSDLPNGISGAMMGGGGDRNAAAKAADSFTETIMAADIRMSDLHNILAKLVPLILVLIGTLPAVITGVVALGAAALSAAAALAAIGGLGALGAAMARDDDIAQGFQDILSQVREDFMNAFAPLATQLAPLFERGLRGLSSLFDEIARRGGILMDLRDEAVAFGRFVLDYLPEAIANMGRMAEAFAPLFGMIGDFMNEASMLEGLTNMMNRMIPSIINFTGLLIDLIPVVVNLSIGFMRVVNALGYIISPIVSLMEMFPGLTAAFGTMIGTLFVAITVFSLFNAIVGSVAVSAMANLGAQLLLSSGRMLTMATTAINAIAALTGYTISTKAAAAATGILATAIAGLLAVTGVGLLVPVIGSIASAFGDTSNRIDEATQSLNDFKDTANSLRENPYSAPNSNVQTGDFRGQSRGGSTNVTINMEGTVDEEETGRTVERVLHRQNTST